MSDQEQKEYPLSLDLNSWKTSKLSRRRLIFGSTVAGLSLVLIACSSGPNNSALDLTELQKIPLKRYPGFKVSDYEVNLITDPSVKVNPDRYRMVLEYITNLAKAGAAIPYLYSSRKINGKIRYTNGLNTRNFYLLTENIPFPKHDSTVSNEGFTKVDISSKSADSFIRIHSSNPNTQNNPVRVNQANVTLYVESCQSIIQAGSDSQADSQIFQEFFCNSVGQAIAMKQSNYSYLDYQKLYSQATLQSPDGKNPLPMLVLPESEWNLMPSLGPVID